MNHNNIPLSLYIHIPWCISKCPYCDFNSYQLTTPFPEQQYLTALIADLTNDLAKVANRQLVSIFLGGGTPSLLSSSGISQLLTTITTMLPIDKNLEITVEANPATLEHNSLLAYKAAGITRISLGAQSFQEAKLKALGRIHSSKDIFIAIEKILATGFNNFNLDLMYNLPHQTIADAIFDLETAIYCQPQHISWYELTIEANTPFAKKFIKQPDEDTSATIQQQGYLCLQQANFQRYEISAFAKPLAQCRHNLNYWEFGDYLGIGAGAHSKITNPSKQIIYRTQKKANPKAYLASTTSFIAKESCLSSQQLPVEFMLNALRLTQGFDIALFEKRTNLPLTYIDAILEKAVTKGLLTKSTTKITPTVLGSKFLNDLLQLFIL